MGSTLSRELKIARKLKLRCDDKGKENIEFIPETASLLNELGLIYKEKDGNKIQLIQGAALLNAAIIRQPDNARYRKDLLEFCSYVLKEANAVEQNAGLVEISNEALKLIQDMRRMADEKLDGIDNVDYAEGKELLKAQVKNINDVKCIQKEIADKYRQIMAFISDKCVAIMGKPPCKYALVGMGSLARKEITPYSDFEHVVVLEEGVQDNADYEQTLQYFRWYSVIFQIILVNLKETTLKFLTIPLLNDVLVPNGNWFYDRFACGIMPDGFQPAASKTPLGRTQKTKDKPWTTELIQPVSEMLQFLDSERSLKEGYKLKDVLMTSCFVSGDVNVYDNFREGVVLSLTRNYQFNKEHWLRDLEQDLANLDAIANISNVSSGGECNIKQVVYRSLTLFITTIGKLKCINERSCFDITNRLRQDGVIGVRASHRLNLAVAIACQLRLKTYMSRKSQEDFVNRSVYYIDMRKVLEELMDVVGERSVVDYFSCVIDLQKAMRSADCVENLDHYMRHQNTTEMTVLNVFGLYDHSLGMWDKVVKKNPELATQDVLTMQDYELASALRYNREYEKAHDILHRISGREIKDKGLRFLVTKAFGENLHKLKRYQDAIGHLDEAKRLLEALDKPTSLKCGHLSVILSTYGQSKASLGDNEAAISALQASIECANKSELPRVLKCVGYTLFEIGSCFIDLGYYQEAIEILNKSKARFEEEKAPYVLTCNCYWSLCRCYEKMGNHKELLNCMRAQLALRLKYVPPDQQDTDRDVISAKRCIELLELREKIAASATNA